MHLTYYTYGTCTEELALRMSGCLKPITPSDDTVSDKPIIFTFCACTTPA